MSDLATQSNVGPILPILPELTEIVDTLRIETIPNEQRRKLTERYFELWRDAAAKQNKTELDILKNKYGWVHRYVDSTIAEQNEDFIAGQIPDSDTGRFLYMVSDAAKKAGVQVFLDAHYSKRIDITNTRYGMDSIIESMGFEGYELIANCFINAYRENRIPAVLALQILQRESKRSDKIAARALTEVIIPFYQELPEPKEYARDMVISTMRQFNAISNTSIDVGSLHISPTFGTSRVRVAFMPAANGQGDHIIILAVNKKPTWHTNPQEAQNYAASTTGNPARAGYLDASSYIGMRYDKTS